MALEQTPVPMTFAAFQALPEDTRAELIEGELVMTPAPTWRHQRISIGLSTAFFTFVRQQRAGVVLAAPFDVILRERDPAVVVQPDLIFVRRERMAAMQQRGLYGVPDLVVEIVSPSNPRHDTIRKRRIYEQYGVAEYWIVLNDGDQIEVLRRETDTGFGRPQLYEAGDVLATALLPGFELSLAELFEED